MNGYLKTLLLITFVSIIEFFGDSSYKDYARRGETLSLFRGIAFYSIMVILLIKILSGTNLIYTNALWDGISTLIATFLAFFLLKERLDNNYQYLGIFMIILGLFFMGYGNVPG